MKQFFITVILFFCLANICFSQDSIYARKVITTLCSPSFHGRGYVKSGDEKAAAYIASEFKKFGLAPVEDQFSQPFQFPVNTFPGKMNVKVEGRKLIPGADYIVYPPSSAARKTYQITHVDSLSLIGNLAAHGNTCLVMEMKDFNAQKEAAIAQLAKKQTGAVILLEEKKLTWSVAQYHFAIPVIAMLKNKLPPTAHLIRFNYKAVFIEKHTAQNIVAMIKGQVYPDSFIVFSAHYDHLGRMGRKTYFPGANDNASGTAMLLNLAKHYSMEASKPKYSLLFIAFAGEEAGLVGSKYFTEHPLMDLKKIKFLINLDLLGTGDEGMMVVNATEHKNEFDLLKKINEEHHYLATIGERGKAKNSDHYYFSEKGVPAFFFYTLGGIQAYHDIYDKPETLPLTKFKEVFLLIRDFTDRF